VTNQVNAIKQKTKPLLQKIVKFKVLSVSKINATKLIIILEMKKLFALALKVKIFGVTLTSH